jgi:uncharacterized protein (DUF433 family)
MNEETTVVGSISRIIGYPYCPESSNAGEKKAMNTATVRSWIEHAPEVCGGDARIRATRHTLHRLVEWKRLGLTDTRILEHHPDLTLDDLQTAWWYYETHTDEIEQALRRDEEAMNEDGPALRG